MDIKSKIVLISGPTASGKSKFALNLAKKIDGEILNADSMQVYKQFKILTARPSIQDLKKVKHHLYGIIDVNKNFSTGDWLKLSIKTIKEIRKRKKIPIIVGGTGLYFKALTEGFVKIPTVPIRVRNQIRKLQKKIGQEKFFNKLNEIDPKVKNKIEKNDTQRSIRAYEIKYYTKKSLFEWFKNTKKYFLDNEFIKIYINYPKDEVIKKANSRVNKMLKSGAIAEVKKFNTLKISKQNSVNKVIGIVEISNYLNDNCNLDEAKDLISVKTRQYIKRQFTWARGQMGNWKHIDPKLSSSDLKKILS
jgi:tRNA dimethylallyltransferase|tara:strand:- start:437 stop:1351 length:915 start_codon:yes stop_codon:yes gene_type:complete